MRRSLLRILPAALLFVPAVTAWVAFAPGLFSPDSLDQLHQSIAWSFDDWHPPFLSLIAGILLKLGLPITALTFLQALAWAAACGLVIEATRPHGPNTEGRGKTLLWCLIVFGWGILPPWPFYAMTYWKDCWTAIGLLLLVAGLLKAYHIRRWPIPAGPGSVRVLTTVTSTSPRYAQGLMLAGSVLATLSRHNAAVLLPLAGLGIALAEFDPSIPASSALEKRRLVRARVVGFLLPPVTVFLIASALPIAAPIVRRPIGTVIMAHELAIALQADPDLATSLPYTAASIAPRYPVNEDRGNLAALVGRSWWLGPDLAETLDQVRVGREYKILLLSRPLLVAELKFLSWINLWNTTGSSFWHQEIIEPNDLGLAWPSATAPLREGWLSWARELWQNPPTRFLLAGHFPWLAGGFIILLAGVLRLAVQRDAASALVVLIGAAPLVYALSFLAAFAVADFRYLYPATLTIQALVLGFTRAAMSPPAIAPPATSPPGMSQPPETPAAP